LKEELDRKEKGIGMAAVSDRDFSIAKSEYVKAVFQGQKDINDADSAFKKAERNRGLLERQLFQAGVDPEVVRKATEGLVLIVADVPEAKLGYARTGMACTARFFGFPDEVFPGRSANVRAGLIVGPHDPTDRFTYWPVRVARGGEVLAPGMGDDPTQIIDARDLGEFVVRLLERRTFGVFNVVGPDRKLTMKELLETCKAVSKSDATFTWVDAKFLFEQKVAPWTDLPAWLPSLEPGEGYWTLNVSKAVGAGLRLIALGQLDGQRVLAAMRERIERLAAAAAAATTADDLWSFNPAIEIAGIRHATLDSRLFRS
jgi:nucleoside-diphosphate-sugar epimerase